jgi:hypothetical protein
MNYTILVFQYPDGAITSTTIEEVSTGVNKKAHLFLMRFYKILLLLFL